MFGARARSVSGQAPAVTADPDSDLDRAIDALAGVLRTYGELAFDLDQVKAGDTRAECLELVQKLVMGPTRASEGTPSKPPGSGRDFGSARRFFEQRRREEHDFVVRSSGNMRQALQAFATCLSATITEDRQNDSRLEVEMERLVDVVGKRAPDVLEQQLGVLVNLFKTTIQHRRERERRQVQDLGRRVVELKAELEIARTQAIQDPLTELYNRAALADELERVASLAAFLSSEPCLLLIDVDHFKGVNDRHGHPAGDAVLKAVADNIARHFMRREDFVARYGGEEFAVLARESTLERVLARADRLRDTQGKLEVRTPAGSVSVTISIGIAMHESGEAPAHWLERADRALYAAKHAGRDCIEVATPAPLTSLLPPQLPSR
ncbi:MAG TPA: GGDEF domain-containing protein [Polyangiaceae bacterium]|jgi:diguanylate cyclase (GGDEF)-like protein|nr:GGDEF domain-containing protein [Polyangiaceae bacterium]